MVMVAQNPRNVGQKIHHTIGLYSYIASVAHSLPKWIFISGSYYSSVETPLLASLAIALYLRYRNYV